MIHILLNILLVLLGCALIIGSWTFGVWLVVHVIAPMTDRVPKIVNPTFDRPQPRSFIDYDEDC